MGDPHLGDELPQAFVEKQLARDLLCWVTDEGQTVWLSDIADVASTIRGLKNVDTKQARCLWLVATSALALHGVPLFVMDCVHNAITRLRAAACRMLFY